MQCFRFYTDHTPGCIFHFKLSGAGANAPVPLMSTYSNDTALFFLFLLLLCFNLLLCNINIISGAKFRLAEA